MQNSIFVDIVFYLSLLYPAVFKSMKSYQFYQIVLLTTKSTNQIIKFVGYYIIFLAILEGQLLNFSSHGGIVL